MKIKDLAKDQNLVGLTIIVPKKTQIIQGLPRQKMTIHSGWHKGLWLRVAKNPKPSTRVYPLNFENFKDIEEFEVKQ